jgi:murein DD-endopeptidase MepM/ murein hydrolase activator NlpD
MARGERRGSTRRDRDDFDDRDDFRRHSGRYGKDGAARDSYRGRAFGRDDDDGATDDGEDDAGADQWNTGHRQAYDDDADHELDASRYGRALVPAGGRAVATDADRGGPPTAFDEDTGPFIIPGTGQLLGPGYVPRRERPLAMRLAVVALTACVVFSALFAVAPLGSGSADAAGGTSPFEALSGAVMWHAGPGFRWYTAMKGDTIDSIAAKFTCQVGGIYEMNGLLSGQEIEVGKTYKIPTDPGYGEYYRPPSFIVTTGGYGATTYGNSPWTSLAGIPPEGAICGPNGNGNYAAYDLKAPNWNAYWVRGFTWYHNGADLANPAGTPIHAAQAGEVIFSGWDPGGGGWTVKINNCNHVSTFYAHMEQLLVKVHDMVNVGDVIGLEGSTGYSTGPHLHFTVEWDNNPVDPLGFFNWNIWNITHYIPDN